MMHYLASWGAASPDFTFASLDVTAAFLHDKLQLMPPGNVWLVYNPLAIYGLWEAPNLWSEERTESMTRLGLRLRGSTTLCLCLRFTNPLLDSEAFFFTQRPLY